MQPIAEGFFIFAKGKGGKVVSFAQKISVIFRQNNDMQQSVIVTLTEKKQRC